MTHCEALIKLMETGMVYVDPKAWVRQSKAGNETGSNTSATSSSLLDPKKGLGSEPKDNGEKGSKKTVSFV